MNKKIDENVMALLEKEVERIGTMYFVWMSKEENDPKNVDVFFSKDTRKEDCIKMLIFIETRIKHYIDKHEN